jgi:hypothetical protein
MCYGSRCGKLYVGPLLSAPFNVLRFASGTGPRITQLTPNASVPVMLMYGPFAFANGLSAPPVALPTVHQPTR